MTIRAYKMRFYPSADQARDLSQYFGASRFAWNVALEMISRAYSDRQERLNYVAVGKQLTQLKRDPNFAWMNDVPSDVYGQKLRDLDRAFSNFFAKRAKYPRFRKRGHAESIRFKFDQRHAGKVAAWLKSGDMVLPKLGRVKLRDGRPLPKAMPKMVTVSKDAKGRYFVSFTVEEAIELKPIQGRVVGIDMGISRRGLAHLSDGTRIENPKHLDRLDAQLRFQQRRLSRKVKGSNRWHKQRQRVAAIHARIRDSRRDYLQKMTSEIIESQDVIAVESLNVKGMVKNRRLARSVHDASMSEFINMLRYKAAWYGKTLVEVDQWFPSTQTCSACGEKSPEKIVLGVESWTCQACGSTHDRDQNAARNILAEGLRVLGPGRPEITRMETEALAVGLRPAGETAVAEVRIVREV